ncbi:hypothetical protein GGI04_006093, partial [Coemansia thaxteri]
MSQSQQRKAPWDRSNKHWCNYCRIFVHDNKSTRALHDSGTKHKDNVQRFLRQVQKDEEASKEAEKKLSAQLKTIEKAATLSYSKDIAARGGENATETGTNTQGAPSKDALAKSKVATNQTHKPPQSSETGPALAAEANPKPNRPADIGVIGEWEVVEDE